MVQTFRRSVFRPNLDVFSGFLGKTKIKAYTKLIVAMCCKIFDRNYVAPSSGDF